jgi:predicted AAA+ superfamily ATPase
MIEREMAEYIKYAATKYPVVTITGPRQSGKTTLAKNLFPDKEYLSLEDMDMREFAIQDPRGFLSRFTNGAVIDEAQRAPDLFSYIQTHVDKSNKVGEFILTGSQNFLLLNKVSQSLAGRVAIAHLLPFSNCELMQAKIIHNNPFELIYKGFYPRVQVLNIEPHEWYGNYIATYLERDVRQIQNIVDISKFRTFMKLCAGRVGQLVNFSAIGNECGVYHSTIKAWMSVLEASFIIYLLRPYHNNLGKRLVKQPKLYFYDTGIASCLLGIDHPVTLDFHHMKGALFENYVISELIKERFNKGKNNNLYFWRDHNGNEVDCIIDKMKPTAIEIKSGQTITNDFFKGLNYWKKTTGFDDRRLVHGGNIKDSRFGVEVKPWNDFREICESDSQII